MDITQRLLDLAEKLRNSDRALTQDSYLCQQAAQLISTQSERLERIPKERFDKYCQAVLTGILARNSGAHLMSNPEHLIAEARRIAEKCLQAQPVGEDS